MKKTDKNGRGRLVSHVYEVLKRKVITLELRPGEFLHEKRLMEELKVGRTPLRESILRLKVEGLVEGEPNKSSYVKDISLPGTKDLVEALLIVEKNITYLAAQRATPAHVDRIREIEERLEEAVERENAWDINTLNFDFHEAIGRASGNKVLYQVHQNLRHQAQRLSYLAVDYKANQAPSLIDHYRQIVTQHREMIELIAAHDAAAIEPVSVAHVQLFKERILNYLNDTHYL